MLSNGAIIDKTTVEPRPPKLSPNNSQASDDSVQLICTIQMCSSYPVQFVLKVYSKPESIYLEV